MEALIYSHRSDIKPAELHPQSLVTAYRLYLAVLVSVLLHVFMFVAKEPVSPPQQMALPKFIEVQLGAAPVAAQKPPAIKPQLTDKASTSPEKASEKQTGMPLVKARYDDSELENPRPTYPLAARKRGYEGRVVLSVFVSSSGHCTDVKLLKTSGHRILDKAAIAAVRQWRFIPAREGEESKESWIEIPINFRLKG